MNRKQRRSMSKRRVVRTNHDMAIQLAKARDLKTMAHRVESDRHAQRALWLAIVAMNDAFGIGKGRMNAFFRKLQENTEEYSKMRNEIDDEYANEKLRRRVSEICGQEITHLYEDELGGAE